MEEQISKKNAQKLANALRSGEYKQTKYHLQGKDGYYCLGVACELFILKDKQLQGKDGCLFGGFPEDQPSAPKWLTLLNQDFNKKTNYNETLTSLNDSSGYNFNEIADIIELVYVHKALD